MMNEDIPNFDYEALEELAKIQCRVDEIAHVSGYTTTQFKKFIRDDPRLKDALRRGKATGLIELRQCLFSHAKKNRRVAEFLGQAHLNHWHKFGFIEMDVNKKNDTNDD